MRIKRILSKQIYLIEPSFSTQNIRMWKSIGSIPSPTGKHKEEVTYQPFTQSSRLRLNQSQLSGSQSPQFLQQYFTKKRSPEGLPHRCQSQKSLEVLPLHAPTLSLRNVLSPEPNSKTTSLTSKLNEQPSIIQMYKEVIDNPAQHGKHHHSANNKQIQAQLRKLREDQVKLKKSVQQEMNNIKTQMKQTETQILSRLNQVSSQNESKKKQGLNPQILSKIRQESTRFNDRIRDIQNRKQLVKEKYRMKNPK